MRAILGHIWLKGPGNLPSKGKLLPSNKWEGGIGGGGKWKEGNEKGVEKLGISGFFGMFISSSWVATVFLSDFSSMSEGRIDSSAGSFSSSIWEESLILPLI